jgi:hypothetical protein
MNPRFGMAFRWVFQWVPGVRAPTRGDYERELLGVGSSASVGGGDRRRPPQPAGKVFSTSAAVCACSNGRTKTTATTIRMAPAGRGSTATAETTI